MLLSLFTAGIKQQTEGRTNCWTGFISSRSSGLRAPAPSPADMQEPEIFEQPVANRDPEAHTPADENGTYGGTLYGTGLGPNSADNESEDYHDFVYPEGSSCFLFALGERLDRYS